MSEVMPTASSQLSYKVTNQVPQMVPNGAGGYTPGMHLTVQLASGTVFFLDVTEAQYENVDTVAMLIREKAQRADTIDNIGH